MFTLPLKQTYPGDSSGAEKSSKAPFYRLAEFSLRADYIGRKSDISIVQARLHSGREPLFLASAVKRPLSTPRAIM